jgi:hypothetical protein
MEGDGPEPRKAVSAPNFGGRRAIHVKLLPSNGGSQEAENPLLADTVEKRFEGFCVRN